MSASYLDIDLAIDNEDYDINQYICSNIPAAPAYGVYISVDPIFQSFWFLSGFP